MPKTSNELLIPVMDRVTGSFSNMNMWFSLRQFHVQVYINWLVKIVPNKYTLGSIVRHTEGLGLLMGFVDNKKNVK